MRVNNLNSAHARCMGRGSRSLWLGLAIIMIVLAPAARAELGGNVSSIQADQERMKGTVRVTSTMQFTVHEIQTPNGTVVREFVSPAGMVFGVAWQGPWMPDLRQLLGTYFEQFVKAAQQSKGRGRGPLSIQENGLVVETGGHARSFFGRAYLVPMMPPSVRAEAIQ
ncbi:MAG TPA: DUF2844 domain-containing protein [Candidatus Angelobacter sp.]